MPRASQRAAIERAGFTTPDRLAVETLKGGVGKTELTANMAAEDVHQGRRVLVVELDPQGSLTDRVFGVDTDSLPRTIGHALVDALEGRDPATALRHSLLRMDDPRLPLDEDKRRAWGPVHVLPCNQECNGLQIPNNQWRVLDALLTAVADDYDRVWFDFSPSITTLAQVGRYAARRFVGVTEAAKGSARAIAQWRENLAKASEHHATPIHLTCRVVINKYDAREREQYLRARDLEEELGLETNGGLLLSPTLPRRAVVQQAEGAEVPIRWYDTPEARAFATHYLGPLHANLTKATTKETS